MSVFELPHRPSDLSPNGTRISLVCLSHVTLTIAQILEFSVYRILTLIFIVMCSSTNTILFISFYQQSKKERAYIYQVVFTVSKTLQAFTFGAFLICNKWLHLDGVVWFKGSSGLAYFYACTRALHNSFIISSVCLSAAMAIDRTLAITKPITYRNVNQFWRQLLACSACFLIGLLGGGLYFFDVTVAPANENTYELFNDYDTDHSPLAQASFYFGMLCRLSTILLLIGLTGVMLKAFRESRRNASTSSSRAKRIAQRILLWINIYHGCFMVINQMPHIVWQTLLFLMPGDFEWCAGRTVGPVCDGLLMLTDTVDFFILISINKGMKRIVSRAVISVSPCARTRSRDSTPNATVGLNQIQEQKVGENSSYGSGCMRWLKGSKRKCFQVNK